MPDMSLTDSLARLTGEEQKAVKTTAFDLQLSTNHSPLATSPPLLLDFIPSLTNYSAYPL